MKTSYRKINAHAWINDTWLSPYCGYIVKLIEYKNRRMDIILDGHRYKHLQGTYSDDDGWKYTLKFLLGKPLKRIPTA
jgi:hypothetical protein